MDPLETARDDDGEVPWVVHMDVRMHAEVSAETAIEAQALAMTTVPAQVEGRLESLDDVDVEQLTEVDVGVDKGALMDKQFMGMDMGGGDGDGDGDPEQMEMLGDPGTLAESLGVNRDDKYGDDSDGDDDEDSEVTP